MYFVANDNRDGRCPEQAAALDIPPLPPKKGVAGRRQAGEVGHRPPGYKAGPRSGRQPQYVEQPGQSDRFDPGGNRGGDNHRSGLVPGGGQPAGRQGDRQNAAGDKAKVTAASGRYRRRRTELVKEREYLLRRHRLLGERPVQRGQPGDRFILRSDRLLRQPLEIP